jgi:hypothetical protein
MYVVQGFIVLVTAQIGAGQMPKFKELFAPLVSEDCSLLAA